ncbi:hypothetical protein [Streptomyces sp. NPDC002994]|uniref:hypothetical protein n=1 Tax=Streptomyces sp. NPDC002994 TaxID=3154441 RepID=UPI0033B26D3B
MHEPTEKQIEKLDSTSEMNLRYSLFETKVTLDPEGFEAEFFQVPLVDFMYCLVLSACAVREGDSGRISFTESDVLINIVPDGPELKILRSWAPAPGRCGKGEFLAAVSRFVTDGLEFLAVKYPAFRNNPTFQKLTDMNAERA